MTAGLSWLVGAAATDSQQTTFVLPYIVIGLGFGTAIAPATGVAMRNIQPRLAGAASGVFNTTRQLGAVLGTAVVGAVLQNELVGFGPRGYVPALKVAALIPVAAVFVAALLAIGIGRRRRAEPSLVEIATTETRVA